VVRQILQSAQRGWEEQLDDLSEEEVALEGDEQEWRFGLFDCERTESFFREVDGQLHVYKRGKTTVLCRLGHKLPKAGQLSYFGVTGREGTNGAYITAKVFWEGSDKTREQLGYCRLNGSYGQPSYGCEAVVVGSRAGYPPGGSFMVEIYMHQVDRNPDPMSFLVEEVRVGYRSAL
jgi:hypothetical protein